MLRMPVDTHKLLDFAEDSVARTRVKFLSSTSAQLNDRFSLLKQHAIVCEPIAALAKPENPGDVV